MGFKELVEFAAIGSLVLFFVGVDAFCFPSASRLMINRGYRQRYSISGLGHIRRCLSLRGRR